MPQPFVNVSITSANGDSGFSGTIEGTVGSEIRELAAQKLISEVVVKLASIFEVDADRITRYVSDNLQ